MAQVYRLRQNNVILPPGCQSNPLQASLTIQLTQIQLIDIVPKPVHLKFRMWGIQSQYIIRQNTPFIFNIHTINQLFRDYISDMKVTVIKLCDDRNQQQYGSGLINWTLFVRKTDVKISPFLSDCFQINLPIFNHKKKQVAQIKLNILWQKIKKMDKQMSKNSSMVSQYGQNQRDFIKQNTNKNNYDKQKINNLNKLMDSRYRLQNNSIANKEQQKNQLVNPTQHQHIFRKHKSYKKTLLQPTQNQKYIVNYPQSRYQLQKAQLRLQAEQFLTLTKKTQLQTSNIKQKLITLKISDLVTMKPNIIVEWIDIYIDNKVKLIRKQNDQQIQRKHIRVFPSTKGQFYTQILIRDGDLIQIQLSKGLAKGVVQAKNIKQKDLFKLFLYGKSSKFGSINLTKIHQSFPKINSPLIQSQPTKLKTKQSQKIVQNPDPSNPTFFLFKISQSYHPNTSHTLIIKSYSFPQPYPSSNIIPLSDIGSLFAIQFRNIKNQTIDSIIVTDYKNIKIIEDSLSCIVVKNGRLFGQKGWVNLQMMVGTLKQINYQLARDNKYPKGNYIQQVQSSQRQPQIQNKKSLKQQVYTYKDDKSIKIKQHKSKKSQKLIEQQIIQKPSSMIKTKKQQSQLSQKNKDQIDFPKLNRYKRSKKIYTQIPQDQRMHTQQIFQYKNNEQLPANQEFPQQNGNVYLVEVLSRFLHALPANKIAQMPPSNMQQFIQLLNHFLAGRQQKQLIQLVIDMFIDDTAVNRQSGTLQYNQFLKCLNSYHNFLELWWKMRVDILTQLIKSQPQYQQKITKYSELGTLTKQKFWNKVFTKLSNPQLKLQTDKILKLNLDTPIPAILLIQDLKHIQNYSNQPPKQATSQLIIDLSKIIKETLQTILQGSGIEAPTIVEDKVNIRIICDIMDSIGISLSYWEGLMLIQELKGWYNIDLDYNEGIISGSVIEVWIKSVLNRSQILNKSQKQSEHKSEQQLPQNVKFQVQSSSVTNKKSIMPTNTNNPKPPITSPQSLSGNPSTKFLRNVQKQLQNKSVIKSQLNEQEIENIANLLRENDNFRMGTYVSQKGTTYNNNNNNSNTNSNVYNKSKNQNKILNDELLNNNQILSQSQSQPKERIITNKKQSYITKYLHIKLKNIKVKQNLQFPLKLVIRICQEKQNYFYCQNMEQLCGRQVIEQLKYNWQQKSKGISVQFYKCTQGKPNGIGLLEERKEESFQLYGVLVTDEVLGLVDKISKNKTIVLYGNKQIYGKLTMQVTVSQQKPTLFYIQNLTKIKIQIIPSNQEWQKFKVKNVSLNNANNKQLQIKRQTQQTLQVPGTFYKDILQINVEGIGNCLIPLQQLYFKNELIGDYPVLGDDNVFCGNLQVRLTNQNKIIDKSNKNMLVTQGQKQINQEQQTGSHTKYLVIFDHITSLIFPSTTNSNPSSSTILANIYIKDAFNRTILYRSPFYVQHQLNKTNPYACAYIKQFSEQNYCVLGDNKRVGNRSITIQLEYQGRSVAMGTQVFKLQNQESVNCWYQMKYIGNIKESVLMGIGIRFLPIPESFSKYNPKRIYRSLATFSHPMTSFQLLLKTLISQCSPKLTLTQQRLLSEIAKNQDCINKYIPLQRSQLNKLINQILQADNIKSGRLSQSTLQQILSANTSTNQNGQLKNFILNDNPKKRIHNDENIIQYMKMLAKIKVYVNQNDNLYNRYGQQDQTIKSQAIGNVDKIYREIKLKYGK